MMLAGRGVPNIVQAMKELTLEPVHAPFRMLVSAPAFRWLRDAAISTSKGDVDEAVFDQVTQKVIVLGNAIVLMLGANVEVPSSAPADEIALESASPAVSAEVTATAVDVVQKLHRILNLQFTSSPAAEEEATFTAGLDQWQAGNWQIWGPLLGWLFIHKLGSIASPKYGVDNGKSISRSWMDELLFGKWFVDAMRDLELDDAACDLGIFTLKLLLSNYISEDARAGMPASVVVRRALSDPDIQAYIKLNRYQGVLWFNKEAFEMLLWWVKFIALVEMETGEVDSSDPSQLALFEVIQAVTEAVAVSEFRVDKLLAALVTGWG